MSYMNVNAHALGHFVVACLCSAGDRKCVNVCFFDPGCGSTVR